MLTKHETRCYDAQLIGRFEEYILKHHQSWFKFAKKAGHGVKKIHDLLLVTGCDVTADYSMFAFSQNDRELNIEFEISTSKAVSASATWGRWRCHSPHVHRNCGPRRAGEVDDTPALDQCVFIRALRVYRRPFPRLRAAAAPQDLGSPEPPEEGSAASAVWEDCEQDDGQHSLHPPFLPFYSCFSQ